MKVYQTKAKKLPGTNYSEVKRKALLDYSQIKKRSKRRPYLKSIYFNKDKIFMGIFWSHLEDKHHKERTFRLKYFPCAIELIKKSPFPPISIKNPDKQNEILHRFAGLTPNSELFYVQIKENIRNKQKFLISIFPHGR